MRTWPFVLWIATAVGCFASPPSIPTFAVANVTTVCRSANQSAGSGWLCTAAADIDSLGRSSFPAVVDVRVNGKSLRWSIVHVDYGRGRLREDFSPPLDAPGPFKVALWPLGTILVPAEGNPALVDVTTACHPTDAKAEGDQGCSLSGRVTWTGRTAATFVVEVTSPTGLEEYLFVRLVDGSGRFEIDFTGPDAGADAARKSTAKLLGMVGRSPDQAGLPNAGD